MVEPRDGLIVVGQVSADRWDIGQKVGNDDVFRFVRNLGYAAPLLIVGEAVVSAVWVGEADVEVEGTIGVVVEKSAGGVG